MALTITYVDNADIRTRQCYGTFLSTASVSLTSTSADCGAVPGSASIARIKAGEACYVSNNGADASATNGVPLAANEVIDLAVPTGAQFKARTA